MSQPLIEFENVTKHYRTTENTVALKNLSFKINQGEFVTVFGPNGCGKTTILNIIAGLDENTAGSVKKRPDLRLGYVFQNYEESLLPWRTARQNISLPFEANGAARVNHQNKVAEVVSLLNLEPYLDKYPYMLSGGKKQLVAIARALVTSPDVLLMDEPFSSLDFDTRNELEQIIRKIWKTLGVTILLVSHDIDEAILLANKVFVIDSAPTTQVHTVEVVLLGERDQNATTTSAFAQYKQKVLQYYEK